MRNELFRRVELAARHAYEQLGELDAASGWDADAWEDAIEDYFDEYETLGIGPDARGPALLMIEQQTDVWKVRQIFDDPAGDHDWGISAEVDLRASDEVGSAVVRVTATPVVDADGSRLADEVMAVVTDVAAPGGVVASAP